MMQTHVIDSNSCALAAAGPLVIGAILGLGGIHGAGQTGALDALGAAALLPLMLLGVTAAMIPALYIATSMAGAAPPAREVGRAVVRGFRSCGVAMLGLAAPAAFLLATTGGAGAAALLGGLIVCAGAFAGLRVLFAALFAEVLEPFIVRLVFGFWALVALGIGARMYAQFMVG
jgi:hypothetical protein